MHKFKLKTGIGNVYIIDFLCGILFANDVRNYYSYYGKKGKRINYEIF